MKKAVILLTVLALLAFATGALAMSSTSYRLDWYTLLDGSGGGETGSASYAANLTIGQTVIGPAASASYRSSLGYWQSTGSTPAAPEWQIHLPLIVR